MTAPDIRGNVRFLLHRGRRPYMALKSHASGLKNEANKTAGHQVTKHALRHMSFTAGRMFAVGVSRNSHRDPRSRRVRCA